LDKHRESLCFLFSHIATISKWLFSHHNDDIYGVNEIGGRRRGRREWTHTHTQIQKKCVWQGRRQKRTYPGTPPPPPLLNHYPFLSVSPGKGIMVVKIKEQKTYQIPHMWRKETDVNFPQLLAEWNLNWGWRSRLQGCFSFFSLCPQSSPGETVTRCPLTGYHLGDIAYDNRDRDRGKQRPCASGEGGWR
jgi:hypothetical protein